jgi:membrane peptidoglycan carboxypeptidase
MRDAGRGPGGPGGRGGAGGSGGSGGRNGNGGRGRRRRGDKAKSLFRKIVNWKTVVLAFFGIMLAGLGFIYIAYANTEIPDANEATNFQSSIVYWGDGETELHRFAEIQREPVSLGEVPKHVQDAVIAAEDKTFWENDGFDPVGIARAGIDALRNREVSGGGSTITQQYVKNFYLTSEQTISRKMKELFIAVKIDQNTSKEKVLEDYLNTVFWGRSTIHGIQTAAQSYFGKDASELSVEEGVVLAAMIPNPLIYDPDHGETDEAKAANAERLTTRFDTVANRMVEIGALTPEQADQLQLPEIQPRNRDNSLGGTNGYLIDVVEEELKELGFDDQKINSGGLRIETTYDKKVQQAAVDAVAEQYPVDDDGKPLDPELHVGLAGVDPKTGALLGFYGGEDYVERPFNNAVYDAKLEPGSTAKPFGVAAALEKDISLQSRYHALSKIEDDRLGPRPVSNQGDQAPGKNSPDGKITLLEGLIRSTNTVFADLSLQFDDRGAVMKDSLMRAGVPIADLCGGEVEDGDVDCSSLESDPEYRSLLGPFATPVVEMAEAYATLASGGYHSDWHVVERVVGPGGQILYEAEPERERVYDADVVADTTYGLTQVVEDDAGTASIGLELDRPVAAKTGTHEDFTAAFGGFVPQLAAEVVYYKGDGSNIEENSLRSVPGFEDGFSGGNVPGKTWTAFMQRALEGEPVEAFPEPANLGEERTPSPTPTPTGPPTPTDSPTPDEDKTCPEGTEGEYPSCYAVVEVPNVEGMSESEATQTLEGRGLKVQVDRKEHPRAPDGGVVTRQDPRPGGTASEGSTVTIVVEVPPKNGTVPNVTKPPQAEEVAVQQVNAAGFVPQVEYSVTCEELLNGFVTGQSPGAGESAEPGSTVHLEVGEYDPDASECQGSGGGNGQNADATSSTLYGRRVLARRRA